MKNPTLVDFMAGVLDRTETLDAEDVEFGDDDNTNVTIPVIGSVSGVVTYYSSTITRIPFARITWTWTAPLMYDEDANVIDPNDPDILDDLYFDPVVDYYFGVSINGAAPMSFRSTNGSTSVVTENHSLGINVSIIVYAVTQSGIKGPTATQTAIISKDTTPPGQPSAPTLITAAGTITSIFDGLLVGGGAQPSDYLYTEILAGTSNPPTVKVGQHTGSGVYTFAATPGTTMYVRYVSYDTSYNASTPSSVVSIVVKSILDDTDLANSLATKAAIYRQDADPVLSGTVNNGSWWFTITTGIVYQRVAGAWVQHKMDADKVLLAGTVVANTLAADSVVAGKIAANAVVADNIKAGEIYAKLTTTGELKADAISTGVMNALLTVTGILRTSDIGKRVVLDSTGITLYDSSDNPIIFINTSGESMFSGNVTAQTLEVVGTMQLDAPGNRMLPGSTLILNSSVLQPPNPPVVTNVYDKILLQNIAGNTLAPTFVSRTSGGLFISKADAGAGVAFIVNNADGTYNSTISNAGTGTVGCIVLGNYIYTVTNLATSFRMYRTNITTGATVFYDQTTNLPNAPAEGLVTMLGGGGSTLVITQRGTGIGGATLNFFEYTITNLTGDNFSLTYVKNKAVGTAVNGPVLRSNIDIATDSFIIPFKAGTSVGFKVYSYSTVTEDATKAFNQVVWGSFVNGLGYYSGKIWSSQGGEVSLYEAAILTVATQNADFAYTYYDSVGTVSQSKKSPSVTQMIYNRAKIKISVPGWSTDTSTVDSVNQLRFYCAKASGGTLYSQGNTTTGFINLTTIATSGATPPGSTSFPALTPASIRSADDSLIFDADGKLLVNPQKYRGYPIKWVGGLGNTDTSTLTALNFKSIKPSTIINSTGEWAPTWSGDTMIIPFKAWIRIVFQASFASNSSGYRLLALSQNYPSTTLNSSTWSATGRLLFKRFSPTSSTAGDELIWEGPVNANDTIMFIALTSNAVVVLGDEVQTRVSVTIERCLD